MAKKSKPTAGRRGRPPKEKEEVVDFDAGEELLQQLGLDLSFFQQKPTSAHRFIFSALKAQLTAAKDGLVAKADPMAEGPAKYAQFFDSLMSDLDNHYGSETADQRRKTLQNLFSEKLRLNFPDGMRIIFSYDFETKTDVVDYTYKDDASKTKIPDREYVELAKSFKNEVRNDTFDLAKRIIDAMPIEAREAMIKRATERDDKKK